MWRRKDPGLVDSVTAELTRWHQCPFFLVRAAFFAMRTRPACVLPALAILAAELFVMPDFFIASYAFRRFGVMDLSLFAGIRLTSCTIGRAG